MTCKRLSKETRIEQDYWLSFSDRKEATDDERLEFLRYDSHGGEKPNYNPILLGKRHHGIYGETMRDGYFDLQGGWPGGLYVVADYLTRQPFNVRPLREWFGNESVHRWLSAFFYHSFGWQPPRR
jgi:hypothetical protein